MIIMNQTPPIQNQSAKYIVKQAISSKQKKIGICNKKCKILANCAGHPEGIDFFSEQKWNYSLNLNCNPHPCPTGLPTQLPTID